MKQSGNALFLILIAVALFAALSYAVTQSGRGGGSIDREQEQIVASQIAQHISEVQYAIQKMQLMSGCTPTDLSFESTEWTHSNYDPTVPASTACQIYHPNGGGVTFQEIDPVALDSTQSSVPASAYGYYAFNGGVWLFQGGETQSDLTMIVPNITESMCLILNDRVGEGLAKMAYGDDFMDDLEDPNMAFDGDYSTQHSYSASTDYGCLQLIGDPNHHLFMYSLISFN